MHEAGKKPLVWMFDEHMKACILLGDCFFVQMVFW